MSGIYGDEAPHASQPNHQKQTHTNQEQANPNYFSHQEQASSTMNGGQYQQTNYDGNTNTYSGPSPADGLARVTNCINSTNIGYFDALQQRFLTDVETLLKQTPNTKSKIEWENVGTSDVIGRTFYTKTSSGTVVAVLMIFVNPVSLDRSTIQQMDAYQQNAYNGQIPFQQTTGLNKITNNEMISTLVSNFTAIYKNKHKDNTSPINFLSLLCLRAGDLDKASNFTRALGVLFSPYIEESFNSLTVSDLTDNFVFAVTSHDPDVFKEKMKVIYPHTTLPPADFSICIDMRRKPDQNNGYVYNWNQNNQQVQCYDYLLIGCTLEFIINKTPQGAIVLTPNVRITHMETKLPSIGTFLNGLLIASRLIYNGLWKTALDPARKNPVKLGAILTDAEGNPIDIKDTKTLQMILDNCVDKEPCITIDVPFGTYRMACLSVLLKDDNIASSQLIDMLEQYYVGPKSSDKSKKYAGDYIEDIIKEARSTSTAMSLVRKVNEEYGGYVRTNHNQISSNMQMMSSTALFEDNDLRQYNYVRMCHDFYQDMIMNNQMFKSNFATIIGGRPIDKARILQEYTKSAEFTHRVSRTMVTSALMRLLTLLDSCIKLTVIPMHQENQYASMMYSSLDPNIFKLGTVLNPTMGYGNTSFGSGQFQGGNWANGATSFFTPTF